MQSLFMQVSFYRSSFSCSEKEEISYLSTRYRCQFVTVMADLDNAQFLETLKVWQKSSFSTTCKKTQPAAPQSIDHGTKQI